MSVVSDVQPDRTSTELSDWRLCSVSAWSCSGILGRLWQSATVVLSALSFQFEYVRGGYYTGDAAIAQVGVSACAHTY